MPIIRRHYWDKNIPTLDPLNKSINHNDSTVIGKKRYYGKSLKGKIGEKAALITFRIIPVLALSILFAPLAIPLFALTDVYRDTGRRIREVHHNRKFKWVDEYVKPKAKRASTTYDPSTILPTEVLKVILKNEAQKLNGKKALRYIENLKPVCKEWKSIMDKLKIELINSGNISLSDLPEINTKEEALTFIKTNNLHTLNLQSSFEWNEEDISTILDACPHLDTLSLNCDLMNDLSVIGQFKELKHLKLKSDGPLDYTPLSQLTGLKTLCLECKTANDENIKTILDANPNLEGLTLINDTITEKTLAEIVQLKNLKHLELSTGKNLQDFTLLDNMPALEIMRLSGSVSRNDDTLFTPPTLLNLPLIKELKLSFNAIQGKFPDIDHLIQLESLSIQLGRDHLGGKINLPSIASLICLKELHIAGGHVYHLPDLETLASLKVLKIENSYNISSIPSLKDLTNLEEVNIRKLNSITDIPDLPDSLKKLKIEYCSEMSTPPAIDHLLDLENLIISNTRLKYLPASYLDNANQLKELHLLRGYRSIWHSLPSLDALTNLQVLRLGSARHIPSVNALTRLKGLEISGTSSPLPVLDALSQLEVLNITDLTITPPLPWSQLNNLKVLLISNCQDKLKKHAFNNLINLEVLGISWSHNIKELPDLSNQKHLKEIYLSELGQLQSLIPLEDHTNLKKYLSGLYQLNIPADLTDFDKLNGGFLDFSSYLEELID